MYIFISNFAEAVPMVFFLLSKGAIPLPLTIMQVLAIDLACDMVPAMGLGVEPPESGVMTVKPRSRTDRLLNAKIFKKSFLWYGPIEGLAAMSSFFFLLWVNGWNGGTIVNSGNIYAMATAMTSGAIVMAQAVNVYASRTNRMSVFHKGFFTNKLINIGVIIQILVLIAIIYVPGLNNAFNAAPIGLREWGFLMIWPILLFSLDEIRKMILRKRENKKYNMVIENARG